MKFVFEESCLLGCDTKSVGKKLQHLGGSYCLHENCALLGYYTASSGNFLPTFQDNLLVPEESSSQLLHGRSLKSGIVASMFRLDYPEDESSMIILNIGNCHSA